MKKFLQRGLLLILTAGIIQAGWLAFPVFAQEVQIDFEAFPNDPQPEDGMGVYDQYLESHFVTFIIDLDGNPNTTEDREMPLIEDRGGALKNPPETGNQSGFRYDIGFRNGDPEYMDIEHPDFIGELGNYFLRLNTNEPQNANLLIEFHKPAIEAEGRIWDIDATRVMNAAGELVIEREQWRVIVYTKDSNGQYVEIGFKLSPPGLHPFLESGSDNLDGKPWTWEFTSSEFNGTPDIYAVMMVFEGTRETAVGLAFDQLRVLFVPPIVPPVDPPVDPPIDPPTVVPEPGTFLLLGLGLIGLGFVLKKNRRK